MLSVGLMGMKSAKEKKVSFKIIQYTFFHYNLRQGIVTATEYIGGYHILLH